MFDHQTMFDDVWSSNISRLVRALGVQRTLDFDVLHKFLTPQFWVEPVIP